MPVVALAACSAPNPDKMVCLTPVAVAQAVQERDAVLTAPKLSPAVAQSALSLYARRCVQRWGYRLAGSSEPLHVVTKAVLAACDREIDSTTDLTTRSAAQCAECLPVERIRSNMAEQAWLAALQARLGDCRGGDDADQEQQKPVSDRPIVFR